VLPGAAGERLHERPNRCTGAGVTELLTSSYVTE
jgi:hypothetical protein